MKELISINRVGSHRNNRFKGEVVIGPTYGVFKNTTKKKWMARARTDTGDQNVPQDVVFFRRTGYAGADSHESNGGCSVRVAGKFCSHKEISQQNLVPLTFDVAGNSFLNQAGVSVSPTYVALLADGSVMGAL